MPLSITTTTGLRLWYAMVDSACAVMWKPPSPQITSGRRLEPNDAPTAAATECPIEARTPLHRNALRPFTGRFAAGKTREVRRRQIGDGRHAGLPASTAERALTQVAPGSSPPVL